MRQIQNYEKLFCMFSRAAESKQTERKTGTYRENA